jgi:hypothetical protein
MHSQWLSMSQRFARLWVVSSPCSPATWTNRTPRLSIMRRFGSGREFGLIGWAVAIAPRSRDVLVGLRERPRVPAAFNELSAAIWPEPRRHTGVPRTRSINPTVPATVPCRCEQNDKPAQATPGRVTNVTRQRGEPHPPRQRQRVESKCRRRPPKSPAPETQHRSRRLRARPCQPKILRIKLLPWSAT